MEPMNIKKMTTNSEPGTVKDLRWQWPPTHKKTEDAEIQTFMKHMTTEKWRHLQNWYRKTLRWLWPPTHLTNPADAEIKHL